MQASQDRAASEPFLNMRFRVEIEGLTDSGVLEVVFPEGRLAARANGRVRYGTLFLRRGVGHSQEWYTWWDQARRAGKVRARTVTVTLLDHAGSSTRRFRFRTCRPTAYSLSNLNALGQDVLLETLELSVGGFEVAQD